MSNPFDQFDGGNAFDRFDAAGKAPAPPAARTLPKKGGGVIDEIGGFLANVNRGLGVGDEIAAGLMTAGDMLAGKIGPEGDRTGFKRNMATQRQVEDGFAQRRPLVAAAARGTGNAATAAIPVGPTAAAFGNGVRGLNAATALNAARGAATAGLTGAAYAAADRGSPSERLAAASRASTDPVALGLGAAGGVAAMRAKPKISQPKAMSLEELTAAKNAAYQAVDQAGVRYKPEAFDSLVSNMDATVRKANINPLRHPKAASMLEDIRSMSGQSPTLTELDQLRQVVRRDVANAPDEAEQFFGRKLIDEIDSFIAKAGPEAVVSGSGTDGAAIINQARDMNTRVRKVEAVQEAVEKARLRTGSTGSGGNIDNATRQELRRVMEKTPNLTPDERAAFEAAVIGSKGQNFLRQVGKLSPSGNGLMAAGNLGAAAFAGPVGAIPGAAGLASKAAADAITTRKVTDLVSLISRGGTNSPQGQAAAEELAQLAAANPAVAELSRQVAARLARAGGVVGGVSAGPRGQPLPAVGGGTIARP